MYIYVDRFSRRLLNSNIPATKSTAPSSPSLVRLNCLCRILTFTLILIMARDWN